MLLSDISVKRPVFAGVISLLLITFGLVSFFKLPLREYPDIDPPVVSVETDYIGANAAIVETKITQVLEDRISGIEGIKYISSSSKDGRSEITIEFLPSRDVDAAANDVRDRISRATADLPEEVDPPQITKVDANNDVMMWLNLSSPKMNGLQLTDYAERYLVDRLSVIDGVARVRVGGGRTYAMRVWLDRQALAARGLTANDIENTLRAENIEFPAGRIESIEREFTVRVERAYKSAADFGKLVVKRGTDGSLVNLGDVARVEVGPEDERNELRGNGESMIGLGIVKQSRGNTLAVARAIKDEVVKINPDLPKDMSIGVSYDTSAFIEESIEEVYFTLGISIIIVITVIYLFLGNVRAMLVPAVTVPVSLIASFVLLYILGYSLNLLTLLALVLAIGLVVDDAIIVLENIHRRIEHNEPPLLAAFRGTRQVGFAVLATTLVLIAVFIPISFLEGNVGRLFREFAVAMAGAVAFSMVVALTLTPMMCSKLLRPAARSSRLTQWIEREFALLEGWYGRVLPRALNRPKTLFLVCAGVLAVIFACFKLLPAEYAPREDRGVFFFIVNAPEGASYDYTRRYMLNVEDAVMPLLESGEANRVLTRIPGNFSSTATVNSGISIVVLQPWSKRDRSASDIVGELMGKLGGMAGVQVIPVLPRGLGQRGFSQPVQFVIGGSTYDELATWRDKILAKARQNPGFIFLDADYKETKPQLLLEIDRNRAADLGVPLSTIGRTLETMLGSRRVTTYPDRGEEYNVILQGMKSDYQSPTDMTNIYVRSERTNELIPIANLLQFKETATSAELKRYNRIRSVTLSGVLMPNYSLGEALDFLEKTAREELPGSAHIDYAGESLEFKQSGGGVYVTFAMSMLIVFLVLAAQFESFVHPLVIMTTVPLAVAGALFGLFMTLQTLNIFSQIGIIMLVGLAAKNGILIVEFANQLRDKGMKFDDALVGAAKLRLRPILMTSTTTAMGSLPLLLTSGAGAESRFAIGVVVLGGVIVSTALTLFIVPFIYRLMARHTGSPEAVAHELTDLEHQYPDARYEETTQ